MSREEAPGPHPGEEPRPMTKAIKLLTALPTTSASA